MSALNILYGCDDNYAPYTGVSMTSLFENNRDAEEITVYLASMGISEENLQKMETLAWQYQRHLVILDTESAQREIHKYNCKGWNGSLATWLRFFVLNQIPGDADRILWLDSDTIVMDTLQPLFAMDMGMAPVGCVCDSVVYRHKYSLGMGETDPYYNAGVILFNLNRWRQGDIIPKLMAHLEKNVGKYSTNDQDLLNDYFRETILKLPMKYNFQGIHMAYTAKQYFSCFKRPEAAYYSAGELEAAKIRPAVIHFFRFLGEYPWAKGRGNHHPAKELYRKWKEQSLWADHPGCLCKSSLFFHIEKLLYVILPKGIFLKLFTWIKNRNLPKKPVAE